MFGFKCLDLINAHQPLPKGPTSLTFPPAALLCTTLLCRKSCTVLSLLFFLFPRNVWWDKWSSSLVSDRMQLYIIDDPQGPWQTRKSSWSPGLLLLGAFLIIKPALDQKLSLIWPSPSTFSLATSSTSALSYNLCRPEHLQRGIFHPASINF